MEYAANRATLDVDYEAKGGTILTGQRGTLIGQRQDEDPVIARPARNAVRSPSWTEGPNGDIGLLDPEPACED